MAKKLTYAGKSSLDYGVVIQTTPVYNVPERDITSTEVPGRNGNIVVDNGRYKNIKKEYSLAKVFALSEESPRGTVLNAQEIYEWLTSKKGKYERLEDDYDPTVYRLASFVGGGNIGDVFNEAMTYTATFDCKPQRFLKTGEIPVIYTNTPTATIENVFHYEAKPIIKIENLPTGGTNTTMLSLKDNVLKEKCLITLRDISSGEAVIINSEDEACYNADGTAINEKVSLNGNNFPVLTKGYNHIALSQYERREYDNIPSYESIMQRNQYVVESGYSPLETTIASFEDKYKIRSFASLIQEKQYSFNGDSYQTRLTELCDKGVTDGVGRVTQKLKDLARSYTIESFTTALENDSIVMTFPNDTYDNFATDFDGSELSKYCSISKDTSTGGYRIRVKNNTTIWALIDRQIRKYSNSSTDIIFKKPSDKSEDVTFYPSNADGSGLIAIDHINEDLPNWLQVRGVYATSSDPSINGILANAIYYIDYRDYIDEVTAALRPCYFWTDKIGITGVFGKAGWHKVVDPVSELNNNDIVTYKWDKLKKGFTPNGSFTSKTTAGFSIRFVAVGEEASKTKLQYDFGVNALKLFRVEVNSDVSNMSQIKLFANQKGFYSITDADGNSILDWREQNANSQIGGSSYFYDSNKSLIVRYLKAIPSYANESDWPTWIDSNPEFTPEGLILNANAIIFKVNQTAYYRTWEQTDETEIPGPFVYRHVNSQIDGKFDAIGIGETLTVSRFSSEIWESPSEIQPFVNDRMFRENEETTPSSYPPEWIRYEMSMKVKFDDDPDAEVELKRPDDDPIEIDDVTYYPWSDVTGTRYCYTAGNIFKNVNERVIAYDETEGGPVVGKECGRISEEASFVFYSGEDYGGFYKYDNLNAWVYYEAGENVHYIAKINYKDTITFYYLDEMPTYEDYDYAERPEWLDLFDIERQPSGNENPLSIKFKIKTDSSIDPRGYYKLSTSTNWKEYVDGEEFTTCLVNETIIISHLVPVEDDTSLDSVKITITPNWWVL